MAPQYKLHYFDFRGLGDPIRLILNHAGVPFEDHRITMDKWPQLKPTMPFGKVPVLETDGETLTQSQAIGRFLARRYKLMPEDPLEQYRCDELVDALMDIFPQLAPVWATEDPEKKKELFLKFKEEFLVPRLKIYNTRLGANPAGFAVGSSVSWADFFLFNFWYAVEHFIKLDLGPYPSIKAHQSKIGEIPSVQQWYSDHPTSLFSVMTVPTD